MAYSEWRVAAASVRGKGHDETGTPCQDACAVQTSIDGEWIALVVSDGAGTAAKSEFSSRYVADVFSDALITLASQLQTQPPGAWVTDAVIQKVLNIRNTLREEAGSDDISSYHCTLVAVLIGPSGGIAIHLGDGAVFGGAAAPGTPSKIDLSSDYFLSQPQNGEYANETVFLTEKDWIKNIRIAPLAAVDWVILGTDGGMALAMADEKLPKTGFVTPVLTAVQQHNDNGTRNNELLKILSDPQADKLTNDDKTLIVAVRTKCTHISGAFRETVVAQVNVAPNDSALSITPQAISNTLAGQKIDANRLNARLKLRPDQKHWLLRRSILISPVTLFFALIVVGTIVVGTYFWPTMSKWLKLENVVTPNSLKVVPHVEAVKHDPTSKDIADLAVPKPATSGVPPTPKTPSSAPTGNKPRPEPPQ